MNKKSIFAYIIWAILFSAIFWYSLVFWVWAFFWNDIKVSFKLSNNIYPDSLHLKENKIAFKSNIDISNYKITSSCDIYSKFISQSNNTYFFTVKVFDNYCDVSSLFLTNEENVDILSFKMNLISEYSIYSLLIDYNTEKLTKLDKSLELKKNKYIKYNVKYNKSNFKSYYDYLINNRLLNEILYNSNVVKNILESRKQKYLIPVKKKILPTNQSKLPNSSRLYRSDYTDWIHHGWDFDWNFWEQVVAIDDGVIIRVVSGFNFNDLNKIKRWNNIWVFDKTRNLDILRGNQIWLKTSKWDVVFYSHLNDIYSNIKEWYIVRKWQPVWTMWITWVPDKNYTDYHLHLPVHKNPYNLKMVWKYDYDDYMAWPWYFKWDSLDIILKEQSNIFE